MFQKIVMPKLILHPLTNETMRPCYYYFAVCVAKENTLQNSGEEIEEGTTYYFESQHFPGFFHLFIIIHGIFISFLDKFYPNFYLVSK